jgi:hypothetical protein
MLFSPPKGEEFLERSTSSSLSYLDLRARNRNGAGVAKTSSDSGVQGVRNQC